MNRGALWWVLLALGSACAVEGDLGGGIVETRACAAMCDGRCVDLTTDRDHCGACAVSCAGDEVCRGGACGYPWPAAWNAIYRERFQMEQTPGWIIFGGACAPQGPDRAPDGTPGWSFHPDWAHLRIVDPLPTNGDRAWVWRMWIEPPTDRVWGASGCVRTRVTEAYGPRDSAVCFDFASNSGDGVNWYADDRWVAATPVRTTGRWFVFRVEIAATHRRARVWLDGVKAWEGRIRDGEWDERNWWTVNVSREGGYAGCDVGRFLLGEARVEVGLGN